MRKFVMFCMLTFWAYSFPGVSQAVRAPKQPEPQAQTENRAQTEHKEWSFHGTTFDNIAGGLGILFGIVAVIAYLDQRRVNREQADVNRKQADVNRKQADVIGWIDRNIKKEASEESIASLWVY
jgi:hypothetical protein